MSSEYTRTKSESFVRTQVVTQNALVDFLQRMRNYIGWRQRSYEDMIQEGSAELLEELEREYDIDWFRVDLDPMGAGSMSITVYGQGEPR